MSVVIKGMKMPKGLHTVTITITAHGDTFIEYYDNRPHINETIKYKASELPPHGRLIDADALMKDGWVLQKYEEKPTHLVTHTMPLNCPSVPTIIEAEKEPENNNDTCCSNT